jgi:hypothetical protein
MRLFILPMLLCLAVLASAVAQTDSIPPADTNLIALCVGKSDVAAYVKVSSLALVRKPAEPNVVDLSAYGRLITLEVKHVYFQEVTAASFPTNIYIYRPGAMGGSFLEPNLEVAREYLVFLKAESAPDIAGEKVVTEPPLPVTNYFAFVRLPQRQLANRKAYMAIADANALASVEKSLSEPVAARQKAKTPRQR